MMRTLIPLANRLSVTSGQMTKNRSKRWRRPLEECRLEVKGMRHNSVTTGNGYRFFFNKSSPGNKPYKEMRAKCQYSPFKVLLKSSEKMPLGASLIRTHLRNCFATSLVEPGMSTLL